MNVGFTGSRIGLSLDQEIWLLKTLRELAELDGGTTWLHHGDCIGADAKAHSMAQYLGLKTWSHPPVVERYRAWCKADRTSKPASYRDRDLAIVTAAQILVACPSGSETRQRRSGTWLTKRMADRHGVEVLLRMP